MDKKYLVCGGDLRQIKVANMLSCYGFGVNVYGFGVDCDFASAVKYCSNLIDALSEVDIVVLPLPCSVDNETVNMPLAADKIVITDLLRAMNKNQIIVAGKVSDKIYNLAQMYNIYIDDYFEREELTVLNTIPTVEGALQIAMEETPFTLNGSKCLVLGYGRIGKLLSKSLNSLGADVIASARKFSDLAWIKAFGLKGIQTSDIGDIISRQDIIFNTIPNAVLDEKLLKLVNTETLIIDLASKPGGVDFEASSQLGLKVIWALSLPGKVAPITAGKIITDTIINLVEELGV